MAAVALPIINDFTQANGVFEFYIESARLENCDLIIFPEAIIGGIELSGNFTIDKNMAHELDCPLIKMIRELASKYTIGIGFGFLELLEDTIYDSYMLINDTGETILHYRRISNTWLPRDIDFAHYACGDDLTVVDTAYGRIGVLLCGDLFDEDITKNLKFKKPDLLLHPMSRAFPLANDMQEKWDDTEFPYYLAEYRKLKINTLTCNALDLVQHEPNIYCGGAWFVKKNEVVNCLPLLTEGILIVENSIVI